MQKFIRRFISLTGISTVFRPDEKSKSFMRLAWPATIEAVLVSLASIIDTIMVSSLGKGAIASVGITNQPKMVLLCLIFSLNVGVTAIVSRRTGQNDQKGANVCARQSLILCVLISIVTTTLGFIFAEEIMAFSGASEDYLQNAIAYFRIIMFSVFFASISLTINAAQRGSGNTKVSMTTNVAGSIVNLISNYFLINGIAFFPRLEVKGAAIATVIGSVVTCALSIISVCRKNSYISFAHKYSWKFDIPGMKTLFAICSGATVEQIFIRIGFFVYAAIVARLGTTSYAAHLVCMNIINLSFCFGDGIGIAASSLVGRSLGEKDPEKAIEYGDIGQKISFFMSTILFFIFLFVKYPIIRLFTDDMDVIALCSTILIVIAFCTHAQTSQIVLNGCLKGAGDTTYIAVTSLVSIAIVRPILTWLLCFYFNFGLIGAWISLFIDQYMRLFFSVIRFRRRKWLSKVF